MVEIRRIHTIDAETLNALIVGYTSGERYAVARTETADLVRFELRLETTEPPIVKEYRHLDEGTVRRLGEIARRSHSYAAYEGTRCVAIGLAYVQDWNASFVVEEFHVAEEMRRHGIGRQLMDALVAHARSLDLRTVVCETQTTNVPAIRFYRAYGFTLDGVDVSFYDNDDLARGEVAVFMKLPLGDGAREAGG